MIEMIIYFMGAISFMASGLNHFFSLFPQRSIEIASGPIIDGR
jgi:hypothetical protein